MRILFPLRQYLATNKVDVVLSECSFYRLQPIAADLYVVVEKGDDGSLCVRYAGVSSVGISLTRFPDVTQP